MIPPKTPPGISLEINRSILQESLSRAASEILPRTSQEILPEFASKISSTSFRNSSRNGFKNYCMETLKNPRGASSKVLSTIPSENQKSIIPSEISPKFPSETFPVID